MNLSEELTHRAQTAALRKSSLDSAMYQAGVRDEAELLEITMHLDEHPEGYEGPCLCKTCTSYAA